MRRYLDFRATSLALAILIALLAIATLVEVSLPESAPALPILARVDTALTLFFAVELAARVFAAPARTRLRTFKSHWLDLLAILPALPFIHAVRALLQPGDRLIADANTGWLMHDAIRVVRAVRAVDVYNQQPSMS